MSSNYFPYSEDDYWEDDYFDEDWVETAEFFAEDPHDWELFYGEPSSFSRFFNGWTVIGIMMIFIFGYAAFANQGRVVQGSGQRGVENVQNGSGSLVIAGSQTAVFSPYEEYTITQGLHGQSYGHLAIDIAAGRGEPILSPINGQVTANYIDEYKNTTLVLENEAYIVTLLHGEFTVNKGDIIEIGDKIGGESNKGYTMDMQGNLCYGREYCGNHTHLNIYDKRLQANVNPLDLISNNPISSH